MYFAGMFSLEIDAILNSKANYLTGTFASDRERFGKHQRSEESAREH